MVTSVTEAVPGDVVTWPAKWCVGLVVPLWKKKGSRKVKGNWCGITLLSVGSKLLACVVAARLRKRKGVDDTLQVTRRVVEEVATSLDTSAGIELSFHDIEKAYPRVCRTALWTLLERWGCDLSLPKVFRNNDTSTMQDSRPQHVAGIPCNVLRLFRTPAYPPSRRPPHRPLTHALTRTLLYPSHGA